MTQPGDIEAFVSREARRQRMALEAAALAALEGGEAFERELTPDEAHMDAAFDEVMGKLAEVKRQAQAASDAPGVPAGQRPH